MVFSAIMAALIAVYRDVFWSYHPLLLTGVSSLFLYFRANAVLKLSITNMKEGNCLHIWNNFFGNCSHLLQKFHIFRLAWLAFACKNLW